MLHGQVHETIAETLELIAVAVKLAGAPDTLRKHDDSLTIFQHLGAVHRIAQHGAELVQQIAQVRNRREKPLDHGTGNAGPDFSGSKGKADQQAIQG